MFGLAPSSHALVGAVALWGIGCSPGGCKSPGEPVAPAATAPPAQTADDPEGRDPDDDPPAVQEPPPPSGPLLTEAAQDARVRAQRSLLGPRGALFEDEEPTTLAVPDPEAAPAPDPMLDKLPGSSGLGGPGAPDPSGRRINGNALGLFTPIEQPDDGSLALSHFHEALAALRSGEDPDGKVRVLVYGASHTDADIYPGYLRSYLQERFGNGGHGYVHVAKPWRWYRHVDMSVQSSTGWFTEHAQRSKARDDGYYGLLGCSLSAKRQSWGRVRPRDGQVSTTYDFYFLAQPGGGSFRILVDGERKARVDTRAEAYGPGYRTLELKPGPHEIEVRSIGNGEVRMFGMTVENQEPGVVVDTLGIGGTRASNHLRWDETIWADNVRRRDPDLYILFYGTNEATDEGSPISEYEADLRAVLERFQRVAPEASCLIMGPGDFPIVTDGGGLAPRPRLLQIVEVQREVASDMGCGFWDALAFMGGPTSMGDWVHSEPQMARDDHIHFTRRGYVRLGMAVTDAIMFDYDAGTEAPGASPEIAAIANGEIPEIPSPLVLTGSTGDP